MKGEGFKLLKRKEGLSFYMRGFQKNKPYSHLLRDTLESSINSDDSEGEESDI